MVVNGRSSWLTDSGQLRPLQPTDARIWIESNAVASMARNGGSRFGAAGLRFAWLARILPAHHHVRLDYFASFGQVRSRLLHIETDGMQLVTG